MKVPQFIIIALLGVGITIETWTLTEIVNLKVEVAALKVQVASRQNFSFIPPNIQQ